MGGILTKRFFSAFLASLSCATCVVATCVVIIGPMDTRGWLLAATAFAGFFASGIITFSFLNGESVAGHAMAGALSAVLAYPASISMLGLVAQIAHSFGVAGVENERNQFSPLIDVWLFALSFWVLPMLIVSLVVTLPVSTLVGFCFGLVRNRDEEKSWWPTPTRRRFKSQCFATLLAIILSIGMVAWRMASQPELIGEQVIEKPTVLDVVIHDDYRTE